MRDSNAAKTFALRGVGALRILAPATPSNVKVWTEEEPLLELFADL